MVSIKKNKINLGNFRFRKLGGKNIVTNDSGSWIFLGDADFKRFATGNIRKEDRLYKEFKDKGFINVTKKNAGELASQYLKLNRSVAQGPSLFIIVLTIRCNHRCLYCQVIPENPKQKGYDMTEATAKKTVDLIFRTPSKAVTIEFQGGEPLLNWPVLQYIVKCAKKASIKKNKNLQIRLVSNLTMMDDEKLKFLLDEDVDIACSFDGPAKVHDKNRAYLQGKSSHKVVSVWIKKIRSEIQRRKKAVLDKRISNFGAMLTVSRFSLPYHKEIIDEYRRQGFNTIFIRPLSPFGLERQMVKAIGYKAEEFIIFYRKAMDYILSLNMKGEFFSETMSHFILKKLLKNEDPGYLELRSPCGAGTGQMAFDYDGKIFTCDEGRMARRINHDNFKIGEVKNSNFNNLIDNEVVKTMCLASSLDNHASCQYCAYKPFCGTCPLANFVEYGTIFPQLSNTDRCKINKATFDYIFQKLVNDKYRNIMETWINKVPEK